jgi:Mg-chelatase subunit ChlD
MTDVTATNDLTEVAIILDRSGSMSSIKDDMEGGLWAAITEQNGQPGRCRVSLYQFDTDWETVFEAKPSGDIRQDDCRLVPRGSTALNDAVVKSLSSLEDRILKEGETDRPDKVVIVMITDGQENASQENQAEDARKAIERVTDKYDWEFLFLAADKEGFADGGAMMAGTKGKRLMYDKDDSRGMSQAYSSAISDYRGGGKFDIGKSDSDDSDDGSGSGNPPVH